MNNSVAASEDYNKPKKGEQNERINNELGGARTIKW